MGSCSIDTNQAGNPGYSPAPPATQTFNVAKTGTTLVAAPVSVVRSLLTLSITFNATLTSQTTRIGIGGQMVTFSWDRGSCAATTVRAAWPGALCRSSISSDSCCLRAIAPSMRKAPIISALAVWDPLTDEQ